MGTGKRTKIGVYKDGVWYLDWNGNGVWDADTDKAYNFGANGWTAIAGDWNGDDRTEVGVYRMESGTWTGMATVFGMQTLIRSIILELLIGYRC